MATNLPTLKQPLIQALGQMEEKGWTLMIHTDAGDVKWSEAGLTDDDWLQEGHYCIHSANQPAPAPNSGGGVGVELDVGNMDKLLRAARRLWWLLALLSLGLGIAVGRWSV